MRGKVETLLVLIEGDPDDRQGWSDTPAYSVDGEIVIVKGRDKLGTCSAVVYMLSVFCKGVKGLKAIVNDVLE